MIILTMKIGYSNTKILKVIEFCGWCQIYISDNWFILLKINITVRRRLPT